METIKKCQHGVYDPHGDQAYCSVCNPKTIVAVAKVKTVGELKIGIFKNPTEVEDQANGMLNFFASRPEKDQPEWYRQGIKEQDPRPDYAIAA